MALFGRRTANTGTANYGRHSMATHGLLWPLLLLTLASYVVETAGISALQHSCTQRDYATTNWIQLPTGLGCNRVYSYLWFIYAFHFFVWLYVVVALAASSLHYTHVTAAALLAIATVLQFWATNVAYNLRDAYKPLGGSTLTRARVAMAGFLMVSICDVLLILALGPAAHQETVRRYNLATAGNAGYNHRLGTQGGMVTDAPGVGAKHPTAGTVATPADGGAVV